MRHIVFVDTTGDVARYVVAAFNGLQAVKPFSEPFATPRAAIDHANALDGRPVQVASGTGSPSDALRHPEAMAALDLVLEDVTTRASRSGPETLLDGRLSPQPTTAVTPGPGGTPVASVGLAFPDKTAGPRCPGCHLPMDRGVRGQRRTCSEACRQRVHRERRATNGITSKQPGVEPVVTPSRAASARSAPGRDVASRPTPTRRSLRVPSTAAIPVWPAEHTSPGLSTEG